MIATEQLELFLYPYNEEIGKTNREFFTKELKEFLLNRNPELELIFNDSEKFKRLDLLLRNNDNFPYSLGTYLPKNCEFTKSFLDNEAVLGAVLFIGYTKRNKQFHKESLGILIQYLGGEFGYKGYDHIKKAAIKYQGLGMNLDKILESKLINLSEAIRVESYLYHFLGGSNPQDINGDYCDHYEYLRVEKYSKEYTDMIDEEHRIWIESKQPHSRRRNRELFKQIRGIQDKIYEMELQHREIQKMDSICSIFLSNCQIVREKFPLELQEYLLSFVHLSTAHAKNFLREYYDIALT